MPRSYATPLALKTAVEQRLRSEVTVSGMDLQRRRQLFVFDRLLVRLFHVLKDAVVLKGGLVIQARLLALGRHRGLRQQMSCPPCERRRADHWQKTSQAANRRACAAQ